MEREGYIRVWVEDEETKTEKDKDEVKRERKRREIVYPCIPDPDGEDEGGQASSSLAVSTRGSLQRNSSSLILQLLLRVREENRRWWLKL
ncbi:hypothetical protein BHM03_00026046 [Ensete ventricosum]|nr:hypothetical protein BHM03_00026046 [Ensete ventricosum]